MAFAKKHKKFMVMMNLVPRGDMKMGQDLVFLAINLDRDKERWVDLEDQFLRRNIPIGRVRGFEGRSVPDEIGKYFSVSKKDALRLTAGEVGCYSSHLSIHRDIVSGIYPEIVIVMEDDAKLCDNFAELIRDAIENAPPDWDIIRLSNSPKSAFIPVKQIHGSHFIVKYSRIPINTGAYIIRKSGAIKFSNENIKRSRAIDVDMRFSSKFGLKSYGVYPPLVSSRSVESTIDSVGTSRSITGKRSKATFRKSSSAISEKIGQIAWDIRFLGFRDWFRCLVQNSTGKIHSRMFGKPSSKNTSGRLKPSPP